MNLINAKVYYDGSHWIAIPHTKRPFRRRRRAVENTENSEKVIQFEKAFKSAPKGKKATKKEKLLKEFKPLFKTEEEASEFVEEQFERLNRNRIERYKRLKRKAYLQSWSFFCTFTFSDEKHTEETFRKALMNCLSYPAATVGSISALGNAGNAATGYTSTPCYMCRLTVWLASLKNTRTITSKLTICK